MDFEMGEGGGGKRGGGEFILRSFIRLLCDGRWPTREKRVIFILGKRDME
jgi:hypothetical protein